MPPHLVPFPNLFFFSISKSLCLSEFQMERDASSYFYEDYHQSGHDTVSIQWWLKYSKLTSFLNYKCVTMAPGRQAWDAAITTTYDKSQPSYNRGKEGDFGQVLRARYYLKSNYLPSLGILTEKAQNAEMPVNGLEEEAGRFRSLHRPNILTLPSACLHNVAWGFKISNLFSLQNTGTKTGYTFVSAIY